MSLFGDWYHITFKYLEMKYPQSLGDVKNWDIYQPLYEMTMKSTSVAGPFPTSSAPPERSRAGSRGSSPPASGPRTAAVTFQAEVEGKHMQKW